MANDAVFVIPEEFERARTDAENRLFTAMGRTIARVVRSISAPVEQELVAAYLMALQADLAERETEVEATRQRLAQRAYSEGRAEGYRQLGQELGMLEKSSEPPPIMH
jgi:hypothetical protein